MNRITRRTKLQRGGMPGAVLAVDAVSPALAGTTPATSSVRFKAIDAALWEGVSRNDVGGELNVQEMRSAQSPYSHGFDQFPGQPHKRGLSFDINMWPGPNGRSAGSISWAGLLNCYFWLDPVKHVSGTLFTQILPFYDDRVVALYGAVERGLYAGLA